jgi:uncharacterized protein YbaR (Trm112 family)
MADASPFRAELLDLLACPSDDHAPLELVGSDAAPALRCTVCASVFPIRDGIPDLLLDDAVPGPNGFGNPAGP